MINAIAAGMIITPIMAYMESISMAKRFSKQDNYRFDTVQELYALGCACFATSFCQGYPVTGSFSRSTINNISNVATPASGLIASAITLICLQYLSNVLKYIPTAALGAVVFVAVGSLFSFETYKKALTTGPLRDRLVFIVTWGFSLYNSAWGIVFGLLVQALVLIFGDTWPTVKTVSVLKDLESGIEEDCVVVTVLESKFCYPSVGKIMDILNENRGVKLVLDMKYVLDIDVSMAIAITDLQTRYSKREREDKFLAFLTI